MILGGDEHLDGVDPEKETNHSQPITYHIGLIKELAPRGKETVRLLL